MNFLQSILIYLVSPLIGLMVILIFVQVIASWLVSFNIINLRNPMMRQIYEMLNMLVRPILAPFQRIIPPMGGLDFSPIFALLLLQWVNGYGIPRLIQLVA